LRIQNLLIAVALIIVLGSGLAGFSTAEAADKENCLMCHRYPSMARIDSDGLRKNYHVDEHIFINSLHGEVECRGCHTYIKKFPHDPVTEAVNCANECHIKPPFAEENFSHQKIIDVYNSSAHSRKPDDSPLMKASKPDCKYCHLNPLYKRVDEEKISYDKTLDRCFNCHQEKGVSEAYQHMAHRLRHKTSRSSHEIISLCAENCHGDAALMEKLGVSGLGLETVETYEESIHGKMTTLGSEKAANCISCHATSLIHDIFKKDDPASTIGESELQGTCKSCHEKIDENFVKIAVHPNIRHPNHPALFLISNLVLRFILYGTVFGLMGLLFLESYRRKKDGIGMKIKAGSSWRNQEETT
jgi:hypothetical protein